MRLPASDGRKMAFHQAWLEPVCSVSREGLLLAVDGAHRITLSQLVGLDEMKVHILVRHLNWQLARDSQRDCRDKEEAAFRSNDRMLEP